jgi:hypothetical protein
MTEEIAKATEYLQTALRKIEEAEVATKEFRRSICDNLNDTKKRLREDWKNTDKAMVRRAKLEGVEYDEDVISNLETITNQLQALTAERDNLQQQVASLTASSSSGPFIPTEVAAEQLMEGAPQTPAPTPATPMPHPHQPAPETPAKEPEPKEHKHEDEAK